MAIGINLPSAISHKLLASSKLQTATMKSSGQLLGIAASAAQPETTRGNSRPYAYVGRIVLNFRVQTGSSILYCSNAAGSQHTNKVQK